jgi:chaperonin GroES
MKKEAEMFRPIGLRVLVERVEEEAKTASGIIIPDNAKEKPLEGKVVAISKEVEEDENLPINVGDTVVFAKYAGTDITIEGKEYLVLNTDDILGKIEK